MKKYSLLFSLSFIVSISFAQWQNGTDIYNTNSGNVGIGLTNPAEKLHVAGNLKLTGANGDAGSNAIEWYTSNWGSGFGHKIYSIDPGGKTDLRIAARHGSSTWSDVMTFTSTGNVGIGTTTPELKFDVNATGRFRAGASTNANLILQGGVTTSSGYQAFWLTGGNGMFKVGGNGATEPSQGAINIDNTGKVGIGMTPSFPLDITAATTRIGTPSTTNANIIIQGGAGSYNAFWVTAASSTLKIGGVGGSEPTNGAINIDYTGNVSIGSAGSSGYKLAVNGSAIFTEAKVKLYANWPDYVFDKKYEMPSLNELEKFIKENNHLPNIPSADEIKKEGVNLGDMSARLLEKIEELTLYVIQLKKENEEIKKNLEKLSVTAK